MRERPSNDRAKPVTASVKKPPMPEHTGRVACLHTWAEQQGMACMPGQGWMQAPLAQTSADYHPSVCFRIANADAKKSYLEENEGQMVLENFENRPSMNH